MLRRTLGSVVLWIVLFYLVMTFFGRSVELAAKTGHFIFLAPPPGPFFTKMMIFAAVFPAVAIVMNWISMKNLASRSFKTLALLSLADLLIIPISMILVVRYASLSLPHYPNDPQPTIPIETIFNIPLIFIILGLKHLSLFLVSRSRAKNENGDREG